MRVLEETGALFVIVASVLVGMGQNTYLGPMQAKRVWYTYLPPVTCTVRP